jgi:hypothetical protein
VIRYGYPIAGGNERMVRTTMSSTLMFLFMKKKLKLFWREILVLFVAILGTVLASWDIMSWKFSCVGDEWAYFSMAQYIALKKLLVNPLAFNGVYGTERVLVSYVQAMFLFFFGNNFFVWKLSGTIFLVPCVIYFYKFMNGLFGKNLAVVGAVLMAFSKYYCNFFKIGYSHPFCMFLFILCSYFAAQLITQRNLKMAILLGIGLGVSFFSYIGPLFPFFFIPYIFILVRRLGKGAIRLIAVVGGIFFLFILVGLLTSPMNQWGGALVKISLHREFTDPKQFWINVYRNFLLYFNNFDYFYNHYVDGAYLDLVTRALAFVGIGLAIFRIRKNEGLLLFLWVFLCVGLGLSNPYWYAPSTRGIFFIPYGIAFACLGFDFLKKRLEFIKAQHVMPLLIIVAILLNIYETRVGCFKRRGYSRTAIILREALDKKRGDEPVIVYHSPNYQYGPENLYRLLSVHNIAPNDVQFVFDLKSACQMKYAKLIVFKDDPVIQAQGNFPFCGGGGKTGAVLINDGYF